MHGLDGGIDVDSSGMNEDCTKLMEDAIGLNDRGVTKLNKDCNGDSTEVVGAWIGSAEESDEICKDNDMEFTEKFKVDKMEGNREGCATEMSDDCKGIAPEIDE